MGVIVGNSPFVALILVTGTHRNRARPAVLPSTKQMKVLRLTTYSPLVSELPFLDKCV
ncbi:uncharacterized protein EI90DRAFT_3048634 [Cantharellus anzutake]|uniref:uncharacterized protein n=1 Tax=Cantharellus anzutake TaxID=1750568 RepID=UPI0019042EB6|nr:uncharacterized protein EI90DRAFT_3048634 [Cantharellus anzutake]KAF8334864.1 hypothetical protein EI90DRAFT_3048634 [Cantharellus anzutake]